MVQNITFSPRDPSLTFLSKRVVWRCNQPIACVWTPHPHQSHLVWVNAGFETDLASIPRAVRWLIPQVGRHLLPAIVHDRCYAGIAESLEFETDPLTRAQADALFLDGMAALGVPWWRRRLMHAAVRVFGGLFWRRAQRAEENSPPPVKLALSFSNLLKSLTSKGASQ